MTTRPATRVACLVVLAAGVATAPLASTRSRAALAGVLCLVVLATRPSARWFVRRLGPGLIGIGVLLLPLVLFADAERGLEVSLRALGALGVATAIASTIALPELGPALSALGAPRALASTVHALLWQLEHVAAEGRRLILARRLRSAEGFGPEVLAQLLVRTSARAERVDLAMRLRGADGGPTAGSPRFGLGDVIVMSLSASLALGLHWLGRGT